ncbi:MAG TPA: dihydrofolate reductase family protein [Gammaproteobacteria bacterium]|nr:dihydrofolate reductase family protein [Gammaproteobacteria bacterium]
MSEPILRLYPAPQATLALQGQYLTHALHERGAPGAPFVYTNFISSLDGRIALAASGRQTNRVPPATANPRDWRLFQELGAQADLLVTSARYFRQLALGEAQDQLPVGSSEDFADLRRWRVEQGLKPQPDLAVLSASLDLPVAPLLDQGGRRVRLYTGEAADPGRVRDLTDAGVDIAFAGEGRSVEGGHLMDALAAEGYRSIYVVAGPSVIHTLAMAGALHRLYLTLAHVVLAGEGFDTFAWGPELSPPLTLQLSELYYDAAAPAGAGQLMAVYDCRPREEPLMPPPDPHSAR